MHALIWVMSGIIAGWLARLLARSRGYGLFGDLSLGMIGGLVGGWLFRLLGITGPDDSINHILTSLLGAMAALGVSRVLKPVADETRRVLAQTPATADLEQRLRALSKHELLSFERILRRDRRIANPNVAFDAQSTFGQRVADRVASFGGSWHFIGLFLLFMMCWMVFNTEARHHFDPFPFILLNLILSCLAALQAPVIMMSQNRLSAKDRLDAQTDYEVNLRAEMQIESLHAKLDAHQEKAWAELLELQRRQLELLQQIAARGEHQ